MSVEYAKVDGGYRLHTTQRYLTRVHPPEKVEIFSARKDGEVLAELLPDGTLTVYPGYWWDGATMAWDGGGMIAASLVHDPLYQMMRLQLLPRSYRKLADLTMRDVLVREGAPWIRRWWVYWAVRIFAGGAAKR